jgi:hypothetical protein
MPKEILNSSGDLIATLTDQELAQAGILQSKFNKEFANSLGAEIDITSLTAVSKSVVGQKFFTLMPADFMPVRVGEGAWSTQIVTYRDFSVGGDFEEGNINTGASDSRLAEADAGVDAVYNKVNNWAKTIGWSLFDLKQASLSGNWDLVTSKEKSRKKNWDLGIQRTAFLGLKGDTNVKGLLTQSDVNSNTTLITKKISSMSATELSAFVRGLIEAYRANNNRTAMPTHFIIPEDDYNGLAVLVPGTVGTYPMTMLEYLLQAFKLITQNQNFKILPNAYADNANNADVTGLNKNRYTLLNYDDDSVRMDIPVDYSNTLQNTINGFQYHNVGYGQYTGVKAFRPLEMLYFDWAD